MSEALAWLAPRLAAAPADLADRMRSAVADGSGAPVPDALAAAALACLRRGIDGGERRAAALDLLAADALLTHACEAAAEEDPSALAAFCQRLSDDRLAPLLAGDAA